MLITTDDGKSWQMQIPVVRGANTNDQCKILAPESFILDLYNKTYTQLEEVSRFNEILASFSCLFVC
jgi:uncharacterized protein YozE (UPF0346 family)